MSILGNNKMGTPFLHEFKKQASFFLKERIKTARLALTDVTPAELLTEEAINGNPWGPDTRTMGMISRAAFEIDDYWRIVEILHKRFLRFDTKHWRESYKALILLEHLLTHGPESVSTEFQSDRDVIKEIGSFQHIDERGFNWGLNVRNKSERILQLLEKGELLKEERTRARKLTRGIEGFGSFCQRSSTSAIASCRDTPSGPYGRSNSHYNEHTEEEDSVSSSNNGDKIQASALDKQTENSNSQGLLNGKTENSKTQNTVDDGETENLNPKDAGGDVLVQKRTETLRRPLKEKKVPWNLQNSRDENVVATNKIATEELEWDCARESKPLLASQKDDQNVDFPMEDHPFSNLELTTASLLSVS